LNKIEDILLIRKFNKFRKTNIKQKQKNTKKFRPFKGRYWDWSYDRK